MSDQPRVMVVVSVVGDQDTEFFVINHALQLVARGPLPWSGSLAKGLYKFKFRRGTAIVEQTVIVDAPAGETFKLTAPHLQTASPVPLATSSRSHEYHQKAAFDHSRRVDRQIAPGGELFILSRDWTRFNDPARTDHPAAGLRIHDAEGKLLADVGVEATTGGTGQDDRWAALNLGLAPGSYLLELETRHAGSFAQTVVVSQGWQTQVFLLLENYGAKDEPDWRADITRASVLMSRLPGGFAPDGADLRLTDTALSWLGARQQNTAGEAVKRALTMKFENPMLGIYATHALIGGRSREEVTKTGEFNASFCASLVQNLSDLVPGHPDVVALQLWLGVGAAIQIGPIVTPPMLSSSWRMIVEASAARRELIARRSLASRVSGSLWGDGPWLIWTLDDTGADDAPEDLDVSATLERIWRAVGTKARSVEVELPELSDIQRALMQRSKSTRSIEQLVQSIGVPMETLQNAAVDLLKRISTKFTVE